MKGLEAIAWKNYQSIVYHTITLSHTPMRDDARIHAEMLPRLSHNGAQHCRILPKPSAKRTQ